VGEGLSHPAVYTLLRDASGFVWIGTQDGADRWDGQRLVRMGRSPTGERLLPRDDVSVLLRDADGSMWIASWGGGLSHYDPATGVYRNTRHDPAQPDSLADDRVQSLLRDRHGRLWVGTYRGLDLLLDETALRAGLPTRFAHYRRGPDGGLPAERIWALAPVSGNSDQLWIGTEAGLVRFDATTGSVIEVLRHLPEDPGSLSDDHVRTLELDANGTLWVGTERGLNQLAAADASATPSARFHRFLPVPGDPTALPHETINAIRRDAGGAVWVGTQRGGLARLDPGSGRFHTYRSAAEDRFSLPHDDVRALWIDEENLLWVGTRGGGVAILDLDTPRFQTIARESILAAAAEADGRLWLGTDRGLLRVQPGGSIRRFQHDPGDPESLPDDTVTALHLDRRGDLWVGTFDGLARLPRGKDRFEPLARLGAVDGSPALVDGRIRAVLEGRDGGLWVGTTTGGVSRVDLATGAVETYRAGSDPQALSDDFVWVLREDPAANALWIGTDIGGVNRLDLANRTLRRFGHQPGRKDGLSDNRITSLLPAHDGRRWWIGTAFGLDLLDPESGAVRHFGENSGLPSPVVQALATAPDGSLWVATNRGLAQLEPDSGRTTLFTEDDGLPSRLFNPTVGLTLPDGRLLFGSRAGAVVLHSHREDLQPRPVPIVLTGILVEGRPFSSGPPPESTQTLTLAPDQRHLTLEFAALGFRNPHRNRLWYRLDGHDADWIESEGRSARYASLPAGRYVFRVRSAGAGVEGAGTLALAIAVVPRWWETTPARLAAGLLLAGLVLTTHRLRLRSLRTRARELERQVAERTAKLAARERESARQKEQLELLGNVVKLINEEVDLPSLLGTVLESVQFLFGAERGLALVAQEEADIFLVTATAGWPAAAPRALALSRDEVRELFGAGAGEPVPGIVTSPRAAGALAAAEIACRLPPAPLFALRVDLAGREAGWLVFGSSRPLSRSDLFVLRELADHVASAVGRARMVAALQRANQQKDEFLGIAAHDLRSPLGSIQSYADLLLRLLAEGKVEPAVWQRFLGHIRATASRMLALVADLLDLAAIETGRVQLATADVAVDELLTQAADTHRPRAEEKGIELVAEPAAGLDVHADRARIGEVLDNLVSNAVKFTASGGRVRLTAERESDGVWIRVHDNGQGLDDQDLAAVFSGQRLSARPTAGESSTGFGLVIVRRLVELHGGRLAVESRLGAGSVFSFRLPSAGGTSEAASA
jgi:ligand-binding sensor domain-containing protein/signal transduction histidine kinase